MNIINLIINLTSRVLGEFLNLCNTPERKGKRGEEKVQNLLMQLPDDYLVMNDIMLRTNMGTTQIDHIVVSQYGVFAIETKNYRGNIYGDDNREQWKQIILTDVTYGRYLWKTYTYVTKNFLYNPVKQALGHTYEIKKVLTQWPNLKIIPIVVFIGSADISHVKSQYHVIRGDYLLGTILSYKTIYIDEGDAKKIHDLLSKVNVRDSVSADEHIYKIEVAKEINNIKASCGICPKCGGSLVLRNGKYGSFFGCSNYPKCRYTMDK